MLLYLHNAISFSFILVSFIYFFKACNFAVPGFDFAYEFARGVAQRCAQLEENGGKVEEEAGGGGFGMRRGVG